MLNDKTNANVGAQAGNGDRTPCESSILIDVNQVAELLGCSPRHVWRLADSGRMPRPHKLGNLRRWDRAGIGQWVSDGCPAVRKAVS